jgi:hypothetical protein
MIRGLFLLIALFQLACGLARAEELPEINFDKIVFVSGWAKSGKIHFSNGEYREPAAPGSATDSHTTRAACPPESLEQSYIRDLDATARYRMEGHLLYIHLKNDTGTMEFMR